MVIEEILEEDGKGATNMIIMGDWNSVVGGIRGQMLIDFCERNGIVITNKWFKKPGNHQGIGVNINWTMY
jgi:hypothetical protein